MKSAKIISSKRQSKALRRIDEFVGNIIAGKITLEEFCKEAEDKLPQIAIELISAVVKKLIGSEISSESEDYISKNYSSLIPVDFKLMQDVKIDKNSVFNYPSHVIRKYCDQIKRYYSDDEIKVINIYLKEDYRKGSLERPRYSTSEVAVSDKDPSVLFFKEQLKSQNRNIPEFLSNMIAKEARRGEISTERLAKDLGYEAEDMNLVDRFSSFDHLIKKDDFSLKVDTKTECCLRGKRVLGRVYVKPLLRRGQETLLSWTSQLSTQEIIYNGIFDEKEFYEKGLQKFFPFTNFSNERLPLSVFKIYSGGIHGAY